MKRSFAYLMGTSLIEAALLLAATSLPTLSAQDVPLHSATDGGTSTAQASVTDAELESAELAEAESAQVEEVEISEIVEVESTEVEAIEVGITEVILDEAPTGQVVIEQVCEPEPEVSFGDWLGYNPTRSNMTWLAGDDFGMFSMESFPTLELGTNSAFMIGTGFHFLDGPVSPDMPARLFDIHAAYHVRKLQSSHLMLDLKVGVGAFSDFEGSARKGVRFPGHAVAYREWSCQFVSVLGVEVLDRDDISLLPVAGFVWRPTDDLICDVVFPRPKVQWQIDDEHAMYVSGELGGGTWAIERVDTSYDNATYRDLRVTFGVMDFSQDTHSVLELGWAFDRELEYRSARGDRTFDSALMLRCHVHY